MEGIVALVQVVALVALEISIACCASIFTKAGYSGWLAALMLVPLVGIVLLVWFASTTWPIESTRTSLPPQQPADTPSAAARPGVLACSNCGHEDASGRTSCPQCGMPLVSR